MRFPKLTAVAPTLLLLAACAGLGVGLEPPEVFLVGLEPLPGGSLEQRFRVELRILNPNDSELRIDGIDFTLAVNGARLTRGLGNEEVAIPRLGEATVTLTATTTVFDLLRQMVGAAGASELRYELRGRVFVADSRGRLSFSQAGRFGPPDPAP